MEEATTSLAVGTDGDNWRVGTGELRLIAAVLEQAIDDARRGHPDAIDWLTSDREASDGWTLMTICRHLDVEPAWIRDLVAVYLEARPHVSVFPQGKVQTTAAAA